MKIEVRKIKFHPGHDDSHSYTAEIYIDGAKAFHASNDGWGGPDIYHSVSGYAGPDEKSIDAWLSANTPKITSEYFPGELDNDLELVVGEALNAEIKAKEIKASRRRFDTLLKKKVIAIDGDRITSWKVEPTSAGIDRVRKAKPHMTIVNDGDAALKERALIIWCPDLASLTA